MPRFWMFPKKLGSGDSSARLSGFPLYTDITSSEFWDQCEGFGDVLREFREERDLTLEAFAGRLYISKSALGRWEQSVVPNWFNLSQVRTVARELNCNEFELARLIDAFFCLTLRGRGWDCDEDE